MLPESHRIRRHFLHWDGPLLPQAVAFLTAGWSGREALDLSTQWVLVPTRQSGRRLREALAGFAAKKGQAVFPPRVLTLDALIAAEASTAVASRVESLMAWVAVMLEIELVDFRAVFPVDPPGTQFWLGAAAGAGIHRIAKHARRSGAVIGGCAPQGGTDLS